MSLFTNGNARVTRLIIIQLALGTLKMILTSVQGYLPTLDFIGSQTLKMASFIISVVLISITGGELFFNKVASLFKSGEPEAVPPVSTGNTDQITKP